MKSRPWNPVCLSVCLMNIHPWPGGEPQSNQMSNPFRVFRHGVGHFMLKRGQPFHTIMEEDGGIGVCLWAYSGYGEYSDPFTLFTLFHCSHLLKSKKFILFLTLWYFSFSFLINLQTFLHVCIFLSRWGAEWTLMRNKMNFFDFSKWLQWNKEWNM